MIAKGLSDVGLKRDSNQDSFYVSEDDLMPLFVLADGMGGYNGGEYASDKAVEIIVSMFKENKDKISSGDDVISLINQSINKANSVIYNKALNTENLKGMGTTVIILYIYNKHLYIGHVGDSRLYYIDDDIVQLTEDHSLVNELLKNAEITKEEAKNHPQKNMITRAVGSSFLVNIDTLRYNYNEGDYVLICSDGLINMVMNDDVLKIIKGSEDIELTNKLLIEKANENGGKDNITTILIKL